MRYLSPLNITYAKKLTMLVFAKISMYNIQLLAEELNINKE